MIEKTKVQVWLYRKVEDRIEFLLLKRPKGYKSGEFWQPVTGNIDADEDPVDTARREVEEETGLTDTEQMCDCRQACHFTKADKHITEHILGCPTRGEGIRLSEEHCRYMWVDYDHAMSLLSFDSNREGLDAVMEMIERQER